MNCNLKFFKTGLLFCILILSFSCEESFGGILPVFPAIPETYASNCLPGFYNTV